MTDSGRRDPPAAWSADWPLPFAGVTALGFLSVLAAARSSLVITWWSTTFGLAEAVQACFEIDRFVSMPVDREEGQRPAFFMVDARYVELGPPGYDSEVADNVRFSSASNRLAASIDRREIVADEGVEDALTLPVESGSG
jgi:hypothetical protein